MLSRSLPRCPTRALSARLQGIALCFVLFLAAGLALPAYPQSRFTGHVVGVEAGDRIVVRLDTWNVTIQLHGITCPTQPEDVAQHAREYTARRVLDTNVQVEVRGTGAHEKVYGEVRTYDRKSLNAELVRVGLAAWAQNYAPNRKDIASLEDEARSANRGIWGAADGLDVALPAPPPARKTDRAAAPARRSKRGSGQMPDVLPSGPMQGYSVDQPLAASENQRAISSGGSSRNLASSLSAIRARGGRLKRKAQYSPYLTPYLNSIYGASAAAALVSFLAQIVVAGGLTRRIPYQLLVSVGIAAAAALLAPMPYLIVTRMFYFGKGSVLSIVAPPLIAFCAWSSVALCRREQILRAAPTLPLSALGTLPTEFDLFKVKGSTKSLTGVKPFVSQIGRISAVYLKEVTYSYDAVQPDPRYNTRNRSGRRVTRYAWTVIYEETSKRDFTISDGEGASAAVDGERSNYLPYRVAHFYNGVPVESWFSRPYPGDTRTRIDFIGADTEVVVWGRVRRTISGVPGIPAFTITSAPYENALVVEADEARIWSRRPILCLLLTLAALGMTLFVVYALSTPGALGSQ